MFIPFSPFWRTRKARTQFSLIVMEQTETEERKRNGLMARSETDSNLVISNGSSNWENSSKDSWLLRLFECKLFDMSMAIYYLFKSKEPGVLTYIANRLFSFPEHEVENFNYLRNNKGVQFIYRKVVNLDNCPDL